MTSYKWEPFDENIKDMLERSHIPNPIEETEESVRQDDMEEFETPEWFTRLQEKGLIQAEETEEE